MRKRGVAYGADAVPDEVNPERLHLDLDAGEATSVLARLCPSCRGVGRYPCRAWELEIFASRKKRSRYGADGGFHRIRLNDCLCLPCAGTGRANRSAVVSEAS